MSGYGALAYIFQLNLPGGPIKIGHSARVRQRFHAFSGSTPVDLRCIGVTAPGGQRERLMLEATKGAIIKGEWRLVTPELRALIAEWLAAGEWYVESGNRRRRFQEAMVAERAQPYLEPRDRAAFGHWRAHEIAANAGANDPGLLADWHGFTPATEVPDFRWPSLRKAAA